MASVNITSESSENRQNAKLMYFVIISQLYASLTGMVERITFVNSEVKESWHVLSLFIE